MTTSPAIPDDGGGSHDDNTFIGDNRRIESPYGRFRRNVLGRNYIYGRRIAAALGAIAISTVGVMEMKHQSDNGEKLITVSPYNCGGIDKLPPHLITQLNSKISKGVLNICTHKERGHGIRVFVISKNGEVYEAANMEVPNKIYVEQVDDK